MREDDSQLIVQPMEHLAHIRLILRGGKNWLRHQWGNGHARSALLRVSLGHGSVCRHRHGRPVGRRHTRRTPQRVGEDANRTTGGPNVFHLPCGNPVVNRAAADADHFARFHDRESLAIHGCFFCGAPAGTRERPVQAISPLHKHVSVSSTRSLSPPFVVWLLGCQNIGIRA